MLTQEVKEVLSAGRKAARKRKGSADRTFSTSEVSYRGWHLYHEDLPSYQDLKAGRNPAYMGGKWGHKNFFLGEDDFIYEYVFRGQDYWTGRNIETSTTEYIKKLPIGAIEKYKKQLKKSLDALNA